MIDLTKKVLPNTVMVGGRAFRIDTDYRTWLRFLIEYVKNVQVESEYSMIAQYGINMGQMLSIPFILIGIGLVVWALSHPRQHWDFPNRFAPETGSGNSGRKK